MNANSALGISSTLSGTSDLLGAYSQSNAMRTRGEIAERAANLNSRLADQQAEDAIDRGSVAVSRQGQSVARLRGEQETTIAAQGVALGSGSAAVAQERTTRLGQEDALTIRSNAFREALGFKSQSESYKAAGKIARMAGDQEASNTLLTGGIKAAGGFFKAAGTFNEAYKDFHPESGTKLKDYGAGMNLPLKKLSYR